MDILNKSVNGYTIDISLPLCQLLPNLNQSNSIEILKKKLQKENMQVFIALIETFDTLQINLPYPL